MGVAAGLAVVGAAYGYNIYQNVAGASRAGAACDRFIDATRASQTLTRAWFAKVFPDVTAVERDNVGGATDLCDAVRGRLDWWRWNLGAQWFQPPSNAERAHRLRTALDAAIKACPGVAEEMLKASPFFTRPVKDDEEQKSRDSEKTRLVSAMCHTYSEARDRVDAAAPSLPIWSWPERLELLATNAERLARIRPGKPAAPALR